MQHQSHTTIAVLTAFASVMFPTAGLEAEDNSISKSAALKAITAYFCDGNTPEALMFIAKDAERKNKGKGSALQMFRQPPPQQLRLREISFFTDSDLDNLRKRFPSDMWQPDRVPDRLTDGLGCLIVLSGAAERQALAVFVVHQRGNSAQIVYTDDN